MARFGDFLIEALAARIRAKARLSGAASRALDGAAGPAGRQFRARRRPESGTAPDDAERGARHGGDRTTGGRALSMLVDSHCHLDFPDYAGEVDAVVARARAAGVGVCVSIGTELTRFPGVRAVAEKFPNVWCSVGIHPHEAEKELLTDAAPLLAETGHPKVVGIGETGLDYYYEHSPRGPADRQFPRPYRGGAPDRTAGDRAHPRRR